MDETFPETREFLGIFRSPPRLAHPPIKKKTSTAIQINARKKEKANKDKDFLKETERISQLKH